MNKVSLNHVSYSQIIFGLCTLTYFVLQPWYRENSNTVWLALSLFSLGYIVYLYASKQKDALKSPKGLKQLLWLCALVPFVSIASFITSPLENLSASRLEPDLRWWLIIPIIIALRASQIGPKWIIACITGYTLSSFASALIETHYLQNLNIRANGDENAVTYGMFNATLALMVLATFISPYIKQGGLNSKSPNIVRGSLLIVFILGVLASFLSGTRAAVILIPIIVIGLYATQYSPKRALLGSGLLILIFAAFIMTNQQSALVKKITKTPDAVINYIVKNDKHSKLSSVGQRLEVWKESWCIFTKHPLLGTGPRSFRPAHQVYGGPEHCNATQARKNGFLQAHNVYFNTLGTLGLMGVISLGLLLWVSGKHAITALKASKPSVQLGGLLLLTVLLCHCINGLTVDLWFKNHMTSKNLLIWALPLVLIFAKPAKNKILKTE